MNLLSKYGKNIKTLWSHFSSLEGYINIKTALKNGNEFLSATYASFSCFLPDFVWSFQNRNFDANPKAREFNQGKKRNMEECKPLYVKVKKYQKLLKKWTYLVCYSLSKLKIYQNCVNSCTNKHKKGCVNNYP